MDYKEYSDSELCSMICESNEDEKDILFKKYKYIIDIVIKKYIMSSLKSGIEYSDLYQEALVGFTDAINSFDEKKDASLPTFITICVDRKLQKTLIKAQTKKNEMILQSLSLDYQKSMIDSPLKESLSDNLKNDPLNNITNDENYKELLNNIKLSLSSQEYEVFKLMLNGKNYQDISKILDKNPKQIDNTIQRIKSKIKKILKNDD